MKKFLMAVGLMLVLSSAVFAQAGKTNYYRYVETVNTETGVRSKGRDHGMYITFTRNSCYESDEKGVRTKLSDGSPSQVYTYEGEHNNLHVYRYLFKIGSVDFFNWTYTFSKDYKRVNYNMITNSSSSGISVYELADPPSKGPDVFY